MARADGRAVAGGTGLVSPGPAPAGPLVILKVGTPRRGMPGTSRGWADTSSMWIWWTFSSSVIAATSSSARWYGGREGSDHGGSAANPGSPAATRRAHSRGLIDAHKHPMTNPVNVLPPGERA
jgi:hypothetical protein